MVAFDREEIRLHPLGVGEGRGIADDDVVGIGVRRALFEPLHAVGMNRLVCVVECQPVEFEVAAIPVQIGPGEIHGGGSSRPTQHRLHAEGTGVGEQIQNPLAPRSLLECQPIGPMIEKESDIQIVGKIDLESSSLFADRLADSPGVQFFVLSTPPLLISLSGTLLDEEAIRSKPQTRADLLARRTLVGGGLFGGLVPSALMEPRHRITGVCDVFCILIREPVDHDRMVGDVPLVEPKTGDALSSPPLGEVLHSFDQSFTEHPRRVREITGGPWLEKPRSVGGRRLGSPATKKKSPLFHDVKQGGPSIDQGMGLTSAGWP